MAYIVNSIDAAPVTSGATFEVPVGEHIADDILLVELANDGGVTGIGLLNSTVTVDATLDTLTYTGSDYWTDGDPIYLTGTTAPGGTSFETKYFVRDLNTGAKTFKIAATAGGAAINITSVGTAVVANLLKAGTNHPFVGWEFWFMPQRNTTGGFRKGVAFKVATSSSDESPIFYGTNDDWNGTAHVIRDADTAFLSSLASGTDYAITNTAATGSTIDNPSLTTTTDGCLLLYMGLMDGNAVQGRTIAPKPDSIVALQKFTSSTFAMSTGYTQQETAGAIPTVTMYKSNASAVSYVVIAIRNKTNGALQPVPRFTASLVAWYGAMSASHDPTLTWDDPAALFGATLDGIVCSSTVATVTQNTTALAYGGAANFAITENASLTESPAGSGIWTGAWHDLPSTDMNGKIAHFVMQATDAVTSSLVGRKGFIAAFGDGTNWAAFRLQNKSTGWVAAPIGFFIGCGANGSTPFASSGTLNWSAITRFGIFMHRAGASTTTSTIQFKNLMLIDKIALTGGGASRPLTFADLFTAGSWASSNIGDLQGVGQMLGKSSFQIGDGGTNKTYFDGEATSFEYPKGYAAASPTSQNKWNTKQDMVTFSVYAGASDTIKLAAGVIATDTRQAFLLNSSTSLSAAYLFTGMSFVGWLPTLKTGIPIDGATFSKCGKIDAKGVDMANCTIKKTTSTDVAISWTENGVVVENTVIDLTGVSANYHIELGTAVTAITLTDVSFVGTPGIDKVHVKATTGTVVITIDGTTTLLASDVTSDGATVSIVAPTLERGLEFTGLVAGSQVKVFDTGTDNELFSTNSSGTTEMWDDATAGSKTVDYVIQKAGYVPIRVTGVVVTGAVGTGVVTTQISQVVDRAYVASSGLAIGGGTPNVFVNKTTKKLGLSAASTLQNFYSYLIEQWIALGDEGESLANVQFPIEPTGTNSFSFLNGWEWDTATYPNSITSLSGDGLRYLNASRVTTAQWACIVVVGVPTGERVRLQQSDGGATVSAAATGEISQLFQIYGDASHGNFDKRGYMVAKVQAEGYDQVEVDVVGQYGNLEDYSYTIALQPTPNGVAVGNPSLVNPPTITDHAGTPVTWNGKSFSITITDSAAGNSGLNIMRWIRYNLEQGGAFQGTDGFNWHDLVQTNGSKFKTVRGKVYGDTGASLKGVRVVKNDGTTAHDDFDLFTADDGTTYVPPVPPAAAAATILANSRVQLFNVNTATEIDNVFVAGTSYSYVITTEASVGQTLRLRVTKTGYEPVEVFGVWSASGLTFLVTQNVDDVYTAWGIDGSTVTEFALDATGNIEIDSNDPDGNTTKVRLGAWFSHALTSADGIRYFFGAISFLATNAIRVNTDIVDLTIENINATQALTFTDTDVRLYRSDGTTIIAATSYSIHNDYSGVPDVVETGVSGLTVTESSKLDDIHTKTANIQDSLPVATTNDVALFGS